MLGSLFSSVSYQINYRLGLKNRELIEAAANGNTELVNNLIDSGAYVNSEVNYQTPLLAATENGHTETVNCLLAHGADINQTRSIHKVSPLQIAAQHEYITLLELFIQKGAKLDCKDSSFRTPVEYAIRCNKMNAMNLLLNADPNISTTKLNSLFCFAVREGNVDALPALIQRGADINATNSDGYTALLHAASIGQLNSLNTIINLSPDALSATDCIGNNALHLAAKNGHYLMVQELIKLGLNPNQPNAAGLTAAQEIDFRIIELQQRYESNRAQHESDMIHEGMRTGIEAARILSSNSYASTKFYLLDSNLNSAHRKHSRQNRWHNDDQTSLLRQIRALENIKSLLTSPAEPLASTSYMPIYNDGSSDDGREPSNTSRKRPIRESVDKPLMENSSKKPR